MVADPVQVFLIALAAFIGALLSAIINWQGLAGASTPLKVVQTFATAIISAVLIAYGYNYTGQPFSVLSMLGALLTGAGIHSLSNPVIAGVGRQATRSKELARDIVRTLELEVIDSVKELFRKR